MKLGPLTTMLFGALAGVSAEIFTYPLEVLRRKMQLERTLASRRISKAPCSARAAARRMVRIQCTSAWIIDCVAVHKLCGKHLLECGTLSALYVKDGAHALYCGR